MRVLEFGPTPVVKSIYPSATVFIGTGVRPIGDIDSRAFDFSLRKVRQVRALLKDSSFDAIFVMRGSGRGQTSIARLTRLLTNRRITQTGLPAMRTLGDHMLRFTTDTPIVVFDPYDAPFALRPTLWLWRRATAIFKRELPLDRWQLFMRTAHADLPTRRFRDLPSYRAIVERMHPMSLGIDPRRERDLPVRIPLKETDVFFAGETGSNSYVRESGAREIAALREIGVRVDICKERLPRTEFFERCAKAHLVWSPQGFGHDCFRHYEAAACGSVPVISRSPIEQYAPFQDGRTAFFYDPEPGGLTAAMLRALERRQHLVDMGRAARTHVLTFHTLRARVDHMLSAALR